VLSHAKLVQLMLLEFVVWVQCASVVGAVRDGQRERSVGISAHGFVADPGSHRQEPVQEYISSPNVQERQRVMSTNRGERDSVTLPLEMVNFDSDPEIEVEEESSSTTRSPPAKATATPEATTTATTSATLPVVDTTLGFPREDPVGSTGIVESPTTTISLTTEEMEKTSVDGGTTTGTDGHVTESSTTNAVEVTSSVASATTTSVTSAEVDVAMTTDNDEARTESSTSTATAVTSTTKGTTIALEDSGRQRLGFQGNLTGEHVQVSVKSRTYQIRLEDEPEVCTKAYKKASPLLARLIGSGAQGHQAQVNELADLCHSHRDMRRDAVRAKEKVEGLPIKLEKLQREWVLMQTKLAKETQNLQHKAVLWKRLQRQQGNM